ncbi:23S rRNA (pseudouridine(1915)-N(3))-methyltransferase RlmH [Salicibibacter halophilus]|uniref:Ribosomal RNA large subunit methyltransferase H n=1 Tax=Salicibibacter halophilus TaxID=2502791 RepID=A0A514LIL0_9BACI|nr:23S rRNA (pseudouridine(1915)-N(3))-methyltransferase RlmH [Salicibibacter halophilus]QDI91683.1 23S rRNA (pseudouridine(1915)-N(3))-methyltransferase RlmH [Salicibibacter halophilus]
MNIQLLAVGKLKEKYLLAGIEEYEKRLKKDVKFSIKEVAEERAPERLSEKESLQVRNKEGERLLQHIKAQSYVIALDRKGKMFRSEDMATQIDQLALHGHNSFTFIIGGSIGLGENVIQRADLCWSFSSLTFPHQLIRLMLMEQIYRFTQIQKGTPYHK